MDSIETIVKVRHEHLVSFPGLSFVALQELSPEYGINNRIRVINHVCDLAKSKKFEEVSVF